jgi:hypothetical protein
MSFHFCWYVKCHITPHGLRVMALRSWRTLICHLEAPKCKVAREAVGGPRGPIVIIVEVIQCKVD